MKRFAFICFIICIVFPASTIEDGHFVVGRTQLPRYHHELTEEEFLKFSALSDVSHLRKAVDKLAVPRVVGTIGHKQVREYIVQSLKDLNWSVEVQKFHDETPIFGKLHFHNIVARFDPTAERYLALACHYDSKYMADFEFIGATDSAVPCAILLNLAHVLNVSLLELAKRMSSPKTSLMLLFFDGEEAFKEWNAKDSIYGARNLADKWNADGFLDRIDLLMLLDLIGMPDPNFYSFFAKTESWYTRLLDIEDWLANVGRLERYSSSGVTRQRKNQYFQPQSLRSSTVEDDHKPFMELGVPVLHLIPLPFPEVWHTAADNISAIDFITTENIALIVRLFTIEYLMGGSF